MKIFNHSPLMALFLTGILCSSCAQMSRSFVDEMERDSDSLFMAGRDFPIVSGDSGEAFRSREEINRRTPKSQREAGRLREIASIRSELADKESNLSASEYRDYMEHAAFLPTESEKLFYFSLSPFDRADYIQGKKIDMGIKFSEEARDIVKKVSVHSSEIYLGQTKDEVVKLWGAASSKKYAGNPQLQNEMWIYNEDGSYKKVFFEEGHVSGWSLGH